MAYTSTPRIKAGDTVGLTAGGLYYLLVSDLWMVVTNSDDIALIDQLSGGVPGTYIVPKTSNNLLWIAGGVGVVLLLILFARKS